MRLGVKKKAGGSRFWVRKKGEGLWVRKKGLWVRKEELGVRKEGLGVRKEGLWVRKEGLWVRKEGLWVRKEGLWVRKEGLWVRKKGCGSEKKGCGSEKKESPLTASPLITWHVPSYWLQSSQLSHLPHPSYLSFPSPARLFLFSLVSFPLLSLFLPVYLSYFLSLPCSFLSSASSVI